MSITMEEAGRRGGSVRSLRKAEQARLNGRRGGRRQKSLEEIPCTCAEVGLLAGHKSTCLRGRAIKRRAAQGTPPA